MFHMCMLITCATHLLDNTGTAGRVSCPYETTVKCG